MLDALFSSRTTLNVGASVLALIVSILLFRGLRYLQRLGQPKSDRRTFSDLPSLVHGPQELPRQSGAEHEPS